MAEGTPGGTGIVKRFVHVAPPSVECQRGATAPQGPENAVMAISLGSAGLMAIDVSPSLKVSVRVRVGSVLFTTGSTMNSAGRGTTYGRAGAASSGTTGRTYSVVSFG